VDAKVVIDRSYIQSIKDDIDAGDTSGGTTAQADVQDYSKADTGVVVSVRPYSINFATGSAQPLPEGEVVLKGLLDSVAITGLKVKIDGYTDNTGSASINTALSQARASEVKTWLQQNAKRNFPDSRFVSVEGHGPADPVCQANDTAACKAQNRRVTVTLVQ
jgi:outer membrane protein OmpA-like peptidoglycan-associated protein